ncbi:hypothetical protein WG66_006087, partial [Moniliophthora roreri]
YLSIEDLGDLGDLGDLVESNAQPHSYPPLRSTSRSRSMDGCALVSPSYFDYGQGQLIVWVLRSHERFCSIRSYAMRSTYLPLSGTLSNNR